eukprot:6197477-Pleurochrysis_carterae.AAC.1
MMQQSATHSAVHTCASTKRKYMRRRAVTRMCIGGARACASLANERLWHLDVRMCAWHEHAACIRHSGGRKHREALCYSEGRGGDEAAVRRRLVAVQLEDVDLVARLTHSSTTPPCARRRSCPRDKLRVRQCACASSLQRRNAFEAARGLIYIHCKHCYGGLTPPQ